MEILRQPPLPLVLEIPGALPDEQYDVVIAITKQNLLPSFGLT